MTLPTYVPELIRLAIDDLRKALADPAYVVDMSNWYLKRPNGQCLVCLAGSVMAQRLNPTERYCVPAMFPGNADQLDALDSLRGGWLRDAAETLDVDLPPGFDGTIDMPDFDRNNPEVFISAMLALADRWEQATNTNNTMNTIFEGPITSVNEKGELRFGEWGAVTYAGQARPGDTITLTGTSLFHGDITVAISPPRPRTRWTMPIGGVDWNVDYLGSDRIRASNGAAATIFDVREGVWCMISFDGAASLSDLKALFNYINTL